MIARLKNIISKKITKKGFSGPIPPSDTNNPKFVTEPEKILKVLTALDKVDVFCSIPNVIAEEIYTTQIIEVLNDKQLITLKPLDSSEGNQALKHHKQLKITTYYNGIHISILLKDIVAHKIQNSAYFQAPFPLRLYYPQRRQFIRIDTSNYHLTFQGISERSQSTVGGTVENLSRRGLSLIIDNSTARIRVGEVLKNCVLTLDDHTKIHFDFTIHHQKPYSQNTLVTIGGSFKATSSMEEQVSLDNFLTSLERTEVVAQNDI